MRTAKTLIRLGGCPGWSESLLGTHAILLVLSCCSLIQKTIENNQTSKTVQCCNYPRICTMWFYHKVMCPKDADRMANSLDPVQTSSDLGLLSLHIPFCQNLRTIYSYCSHLKIVLFLLMTVIILKIKAYCSEEQIRRVFHDNLEIIFVISP